MPHITSYDDIRRSVKQLKERYAYVESDFWSETNRLFFEYVQDLSDRSLDLLRFHTGFITGASIQQLAHNPVRWASEEERERLDLIKQYIQFTENLPEQFHCHEPVPAKGFELLGMYYRNKLVTVDIVRYQRAVTNLYNLGLINPSVLHRTFLEIGAGYGGLANQLLRTLGPRDHYVIVDLVDMLFWSAVFLLQNQSHRRIYIYDSSINSELDIFDVILSNDIVLITPEDLLGLPSFVPVDVAINMASMQEMTDAQVQQYCNFLAMNMSGWFMSCNVPRHPYNRQLMRNLSEIFAEFFICFPDYSGSESGNVWQSFTHFCTPKNQPAHLTPNIRKIFSDGFTVEF